MSTKLLGRVPRPSGNGAGPPPQLSEVTNQGRDANNFDLLRVIAALLVIFAHSFALTGFDEPAAGWLHEDWGELGVIVFFSISGFLVARSWIFDPRPLPFAVRRALRLMPALLLSLLLTVFVLGPLVTTLPLEHYLQDPGTKAYVLSNATLQSDYTLPGVFASTTYPVAVNGSLWTLPVECKGYVLLLVLGLAGMLTRRRLLMPLVAILFALLAVDSLRAGLPLGDHVVATMANIQAPASVLAQAKAGLLQEWARLFASFTIGAALLCVARWIPLRWSIGGAIALVWIGFALQSNTNAVPTVTALLTPYIVLLLAYRTTHWVRLPAKLGDYSYGLYIFAFPVQQAISQWLRPAGWLMLALCTPVTLALAVASWHLVEEPSLRLKTRLMRPREQSIGANAGARSQQATTSVALAIVATDVVE